MEWNDAWNGLMEWTDGWNIS